jgi:hypothetical protein
MISLRITGCWPVLITLILCTACNPATPAPAPAAAKVSPSRPTAVATAAAPVGQMAEPTHVLLPPITPSSVPADPQPTLPPILLPSVIELWPMFPTDTPWGTSLYLCPQSASEPYNRLRNPSSAKETPSELKIQIGYTYVGTVHTLGDLNEIGIIAYAVMNDGQQVPGTNTPASHICVGDSTAELTIHRISGTEPLTSTAVIVCLIDRRQQPQEFCQFYWYAKQWGPAPTEP